MKRAESKERTAWLSYMPAVFLFIIYPCMVHNDLVRTGLEKKPWFPNLSEQSDFFMHSRSMALIALAVWMLLLLADRHLLRQKAAKRAKCSLRTWIPLLCYAALTVGSTLVSVNRDFSLYGVSEQYETLWVLLAYLVLFVWFCDTAAKPGVPELYLQLLLAGAAVQCLIGFSQLLQHDFWNTAAGRWLIFLGTAQTTGLDYAFSEGGRVYLSFYNPNYAAVYLLLVLPASVAGIRKFGKRWQRISSAVLTVCLLICLWGTGSRAALFTLTALAVGMLLMHLDSAKKRIFCLMGCLACIGACCWLGLASGNADFQKLQKAVWPEQKHYKLQEVVPMEDSVLVRFDGRTLELRLETQDGNTYFAVRDENGNPYPLQQTDGGRFVLADPVYPNLEFEAHKKGGDEFLILHRLGIPWQFLKEAGSAAYRYRTLYGKYDEPVNAPYAFGKGYERAMSDRMYLWSRTVPLLPKYLLLGSGPNTYALVFPQNDYVTRANIDLDMLMQVISRPHSMYLQTAVQTGVLSLIALLIFFGNYAGRALRVRKKQFTDTAIWLSVLGFFVMGLANDAVIVTAPIFWALAGIGFAQQSPQ